MPIVSSSGITGRHDQAKVGPPAVVTGRYGTLGDVFFLDEPCWPLNTTLYVKDFHGNDPRFCYLFLQSQKLGSHGSAAAVPGVNRNVLHQLWVRVPAVAAQRKIAAVLSAYDDLIENNTRRIKILEDLAQALYHEWFVEFRFPGHEDVPSVESELGRVPDGWLVRRLGDVASQARAILDPQRFPDELFEHYSIPAFDEGRRPRLELGSTIMSNKFLVSRPCVLYSKLNPRIPRVWLAAPQSGNRSLSSTELIVLTPQRHWNLSTIYSLLVSDTFAERVTGMAGGTSTSHQRVRPSDLLALPIADPGAHLCDLFDRMAGQAFALAEKLRGSMCLLRTTRDLLLPRLISGEIDVSDLNITLPEAAA